MSTHLRFLDTHRSNLTLRRLGAWATQILVILILACSLVGAQVAPVSAALAVPAASTQQEDTSVFTFASMGDAQAEAENFTDTVNQISSLNPSLVLFNGDIENEGVTTTGLNTMVGVLKNANLFNRTFMVRGNHDDHVSGSAALWENYFETAPNIKTLPTGVSNYVSLSSSVDTLNYSFIYENSMFIGLDVPGDPDLLTTTQLNWLDTRLTYAEGQGLTHAFIFFHGPLYCVESVHCMCSDRMDADCTPAALVTVINKHPIVSATFHGHEHILGWTHMDNTRLAGLTGTFEQFITSPSGGWTYNQYVNPARMDYYYPSMSSSQGFATVTVNGNSFTYDIYKVGTATPVWTKTFTKGTSETVTTYTISGNVGIAEAMLSYVDGAVKTVTADGSGNYALTVSENWSGTVTPYKAGYTFTPLNRAYTNVTEDQTSQNYTAATSTIYYVDKTNPACVDAGPGSSAQPFCTITRGAAVAVTPGTTVLVVAGTYAETVFIEYSGTEGKPITFQANPGVTVTGNPTGFGSAFAMGSRSYIVIDGFTITNTPYKGIYVDSSNHITISNNHVSNAGVTSATHPYEQGIYLRNTTYSTITGNVTDHNTCIGIRVVTGGYNLISNNISFSNYSVVETDAAGIELTGSSNNTVINNITYSNEDSGINVYILDGGPASTNNLVIGNLSYENGDHGIDTNNSPYNTYIGNTVHGNGTVGINIEGEPNTGSHHATVYNNISTGNGFTPPTGSFGGNMRVDTPSVSGTVIDYNLFYRQNASVQLIWNNVSYLSLAAFQAAVPNQEVHGLEGDPLFVDPVPSALRQNGVPYLGAGLVGDYNLNPGSPAIDSANSGAPHQPLYDLAGNVRIDDPAIADTGAGVRTYDDRGAYEFLPSGPSLPIVTTQAVTAITTTTATGNGTITAPGAPNPTQHGVVWSTSANPTIADNKTTEGPVSGAGAFTSTMTGLAPGTLYHVRAYATNDVGTVYGEDVTFRTLLTPTVTTQAVTNITATTATGNGNVTALGVPNPTQHGVVWGTSANPTIADSKTTEGPVSATGAFTSNLTGLTPGTLYYVRAYATNSAGTVYGDEVTFTTLLLPSVTTQEVTEITQNTATGNGSITALGVPNPTQHGFVWATTENPTTANSKTTNGPVSETGAFTGSITGLTPGTLYYVRAYATNPAGTVYGENVVFTTLLGPSVTTQPVTDITTTSATGNGNITALGSSDPTEHGVVWSTSVNPTIADNKTTDGPVSATGAFTSSMTGLTPGTLYHVRAYATNAAGTSYGSDVTFTTLITPTVTTLPVTNIGTTTATANGSITALGVPNPTQHGFVWSISANPTIADSKTTNGPASATGAFTGNLTGLVMGMQYHVRAYATNAVGTVYGEDVVFTTLPSTTSTTTPATNAGTGADASGVGTATWLNTGYITADDTSYSTVTLNNATSHYLQGTNYGFAIPVNADINGIAVTIGRYESGTGTGNDVRDSAVRLLKDGVVTGTNKAATATEWPTGSPVAAVYGANNDLWGATWTAADINASNFGVALSANSTNNRIAYVDYIQISVTYTVTVGSSTTTVSCGEGTPILDYGSELTCVATVVRGSGTKTPTGEVSWTSTGSGSFATSPCVLSGVGGTASCSVTYTPSTVGSGAHEITAVYAGDSSFFSSSGSQVVTVNKKAASVTPDAASKIYGETDPALTGTLVGFLPADNVTATYTRVNGETVADDPYTISAVLSPADVLANYAITYNTAGFTISKKDASVTVAAAGKIYGETDPVLTGTLAGFLPADNVTAAYTRAEGETVADGPYTISATLNPAEVLANYAITYTTADFTISKKDASVTPTTLSKTYGEADPALTGTLVGFLPADEVTATYIRTAGETVAQSPYMISAELSPASVLGNYAITYNTADFTINKKSASVTPDDASKPMGEVDPTLTGTLTGFLPADNVTAAYSRIEGETVEGSPYTISAVLSPADVLGNYDITYNTASFTITAPLEEYTLTINKVGYGTITATPSLDHYHYGDVVTLTATPDPGWSFFNWSANVVGGKVTIQGNTTVTAMFTQDEYTLTIEKVGSGTVVLDPPKTTYHYGDVVDLTAMPAAGWSFGSWSANVVDDSVTITGNTTVTATFTQNEYTLAVETTGSGAVTKDPDQATYHYGDVVTLTAVPEPGWSFGSWSENVVDGSVTISGNTTVTAAFTQDEYTLTLEKVGSGTLTKTPDQATYHYGDVVTLTATPDVGWSFGSWSENVVDGSVTVTGNTTVTATFTQNEYTLTVDATGSGTVTKDPDRETYHYGDLVALTAVPEPGWSFGSWSENVVDGSVTITGNTTVAVTFTQDEYTLTIETIGSGTVTKAPDNPTYHYGDVVTLTTTPEVGWSFGNWSANVVDGSVTIAGNTTVTATFTQDEYVLTIEKIGSGTVTPDPDQTTYHYGDVVALTATPEVGWSFGSWSTNVVDGSVTITGATTVTATFTQNEYALTIETKGNGTVSKDPDQATYHYGDVVALTATPELGWSFGSWSANVVDGSITITGATTVTVTFTQDEYTLTINKVGSGTITIVPEQPVYHYGDSVQLTAAADEGWSFSGWSGDLSSLETQQNVSMTGNKVITATFSELSLPAVTTGAVTEITTTGATGSGSITALGAPRATEHGLVWSTSADPTTADNKTTEGPVSETGAFTSAITELTPGTLYHVRAYATNTQGTVYGEDVTFTTHITPSVTTQVVTGITTTSATANGSITELGVPEPTEHGVVWSTTADPTTADNKTTEGPVSATGAFTSSITGLTPGTLYHVRAYATNAAGTSYGSDVTFTTLIAPTVTTQAVTGITNTTATGNGNIIDLGIPNPTEHGVVWSTSANPTTTDSKTTDGPVSATGAFTSSITGLTPGTLYYVRAYATNEAGTSYGEEVTFTASQTPTVTTQAVTAITTTTATGNGSVTHLGIPSATQHGVVWGTADNPTVALSTKTEQGVPAGTGTFTSSITGLTPGTLYHVRAYATNEAGTSYGEDVTFTTLIAPTVTTQAVTGIGATAATGNGNITALGVPNPTEHGFVWATTANPTIANSKTTDGPVSATGAFTSTISDLLPSTLYHVRAYATNAAGTSYGNDVTFTTSPATTVTFTSSGSWTAPAGVTSVTVEVWGGGGKGGSTTSGTGERLGGGGGGGAYSKATINVTPGTSYSYVVGAGATGTGAGGDTYFINASTVMAKGGNSVATNATNGATGGSASTGVGTTKYSGGTGANGNSSSNYGGGGGSSAGTGATGANATNQNGANAPTGGGDGGNGRSGTSGGGSAGQAPGGGGGGAYKSTYSSSAQNGGNGAGGQIRITYYVEVKSTTASVSCGAGTPAVTYGGSLSCVATVTASSGTLSPSGTVSWTTNGSGSIITSPCTLTGTGGTASCSVTYTPSAVGTGSHLIRASYAGNSNFVASNGSQLVTVNKKAASVTPDAASKIYGETDPALTGTLVGFLPADNVTATYSRAAGETVADGPYPISAELSPAGVLANYDITYNTANFTINKKDASVSATAASKTYGEADPALTGTLAGFLPEDNVTAVYSRAAGETVADGPYPISGELSPAGVLGNYNITYTTADFTINQKDASVTPDDATKTFGEADPVLTGTLVGFLPTDNVTAAYSRAEGETVEGSPYTISATLNPVEVLGNYNITYNTASFTITPRLEEYTLTIEKVGSGTVTQDPDQATYQAGAVVHLTATPEVGWSFGGWSENVVDGSVTITGNTTVTATFTQNEYTLTIETTGNGTVTKAPDQATYHHGDVVTLTATPETGWRFESWSENVVDGSVTISDNTTVTATFTEIINAAPSFTSEPVTSVDEDVTYTYNITAADPDAGTTLTISAPTRPEWLTFTDNSDGTATLTGVPTNAEVGSHDVVLQVTDGALTADQAFSITVANTNDAPSFTSTPVTEAAEDAVYTYNITVSDPDAGAVITISAPEKPEWLTLTDNGDGTAVLTGTPGNGDVGIIQVTLRASDATVEVDQVFTIDVGSANDGPAFTSEPVTSVDEDALYTYNITATDPDAGAVLTIGAPTLPAWLTFTDNGDGTAILTGTPSNSEVGEHLVALQVSDGVELASQSFTITVANTNDAPALTQPADQNNTLGDVVNLQLSATDIDAGSTLTYSASGLPGGLSIDPVSGLVSGTLSGEPGVYPVTASVDDGNGGTDNKQFNWTVTELTITYTLTVNKVGNGTVTPDKVGPYPLNEVVELTAVADEGWTFSAWDGCSGTGSTCSVIMDGDKTVTATFTQNEYTLTVEVAGNGVVNRSIAGPYHWNDVVELTAVPDAGWAFSSWAGCTGATNTCSVTMDGDKTVTATFTQVTQTTLTAGTHDDAHAAWIYTGAWASWTTTGPYLDTLHYTFSVGDSVEAAFTGRQIKLSYQVGPSGGMVEVYVDGEKVASIDQNNASWEWQRIWTSDLFSEGTHNLRLVYASGGFATLDSIEVIAEPVILSPGTHDDANAAFTYDSGWQTMTEVSGPYQGTLRYSYTVGNSTQVAFTGRQVKLTYLAAPTAGIMDVYVDGGKVGSIDQHSETWDWGSTWTSELLSAGTHSLRLVYASDGFTSLDSLEVIAEPVTLATGSYDNADAAFSYSGSWQTMTDAAGPYLGTLHYSYRVGDSALAYFTGRQIRLTYLAGPTAGIADIFVDGVKVGSIDQRSETWDWGSTWTSELLPAGTHSLRIVYASGGFTSVDSMEVIAEPATLSNGVYDEVDAAFSYSGSWQTMSGAGGPYLGTLHYSYRVGDSAQVYFTGRQIRLTYLAGPTAGIVDIYIDGVKVSSIDQYSDSWDWQKTWTSDLFSEGTHSLRVVYGSGGFTNVDSIEVIAEPVILAPGTYDNADAAFTYTGAWLTLTSVTGPYLETLHYTYDLGDTAQVAFTGQQITLTYYAGPDAGIADIYVDGDKVAFIDGYSEAWEWQKTWTSELLTAGEHSLRIVYASGASSSSFTSIDSITVIP